MAGQFRHHWSGRSNHLKFRLLFTRSPPLLSRTLEHLLQEIKSQKWPFTQSPCFHLLSHFFLLYVLFWFFCVTYKHQAITNTAKKFQIHFSIFILPRSSLPPARISSLIIFRASVLDVEYGTMSWMHLAPPHSRNIAALVGLFSNKSLRHPISRKG